MDNKLTNVKGNLPWYNDPSKVKKEVFVNGKFNNLRYETTNQKDVYRDKFTGEILDLNKSVSYYQEKQKRSDYTHTQQYQNSAPYQDPNIKNYVKFIIPFWILENAHDYEIKNYGVIDKSIDTHISEGMFKSCSGIMFYQKDSNGNIINKSQNVYFGKVMTRDEAINSETDRNRRFNLKFNLRQNPEYKYVIKTVQGNVQFLELDKSVGVQGYDLVGSRVISYMDLLQRSCKLSNESNVNLNCRAVGKLR